MKDIPVTIVSLVLAGLSGVFAACSKSKPEGHCLLQGIACGNSTALTTRQ